jgi:hypothetical protein
MWLSSWLLNWKRSASGECIPTHGSSRQRARFRPRLEVLEDRTLLSSYFAATTSDLIADINAANKAGGANTITLTAPTTSPYVLTAVNTTANGANGLPVISSNKGDNLTIIGNGDTIERSAAAGTPAFRLFGVAAGSSLTLKSLTLQNGLAFGSGSAADAGAIYNQGTLSLSGVTVQNNVAQGSKGADGVLNSQLKKGQSINGQVGADAAGGGIWSSGSVTLQGGTTLGGNQALGGQGGAAGYSHTANGNGGNGGGGFGGGLYEAGGSVTITSATLAGNTAFGGTGGDSVRFRQRGVSGNGGIGSGGGVYVANGTLNMGDPLGLSSVTVQSNLARGGTGGLDWAGDYSFLSGRGGNGSGGGIAVAGGTVTLAFVDLLSNTAQGGTGGAGVTSLSSGGPGGAAFGGGLYVGGGTVTLTNDTLTNNQVVGGTTYGGYSGSDIYIASGATVYLDSFTLAHHTGSIVGTYILLP